MADDGSAQSATVWPLAKFSFRLRLGDWSVSFQEVSGLDHETQAVEFRHGDSKLFSTAKLPGIEKKHSVTLKRGVIASDDMFWHWHDAAVAGTVKRDTLTIELMDEAGGVLYAWTLKKAYPMKLSVSDLKSEGNEVSVETLEIECEEIEVVGK